MKYSLSIFQLKFINLNRYALRNSIFGINLLIQEDILDIIMDIFSGSKTELILNVLTFSDLTRWE